MFFQEKDALRFSKQARQARVAKIAQDNSDITYVLSWSTCQLKTRPRLFTTLRMCFFKLSEVGVKRGRCEVQIALAFGDKP
eukprot:3745820-Amphidinium_carterae.1